jgi:hypothetical protein
MKRRKVTFVAGSLQLAPDRIEAASGPCSGRRPEHGPQAAQPQEPARAPRGPDASGASQIKRNLSQRVGKTPGSTDRESPHAAAIFLRRPRRASGQRELDYDDIVTNGTVWDWMPADLACANARSFSTVTLRPFAGRSGCWGFKRHGVAPITICGSSRLMPSSSNPILLFPSRHPF